ncbi:hypothetical protein SKAU_G00143300 [Synaphobranchus kaupii]|uniref:Uncharacterized protein n=1 Tax=Synaphobranchus kaupii TaxID=118154 RepID=A0A9Q1FT52_SYNKA|nr:hypothetical protein SKAU_G00143300 [Synaphobranchus kaupii]
MSDTAAPLHNSSPQEGFLQVLPLSSPHSTQEAKVTVKHEAWARGLRSCGPQLGLDFLSSSGALMRYVTSPDEAVPPGLGAESLKDGIQARPERRRKRERATNKRFGGRSENIRRRRRKKTAALAEGRAGVGVAPLSPVRGGAPLDQAGRRQIWVCARHLRSHGVVRPRRSHIHLCNICNAETQLLITPRADPLLGLMNWSPDTSSDLGQREGPPS